MPEREPTDIERVKTVDVLFGINGLEYRRLIDALRKGKLYKNAVDPIVII